MEFLNLPWSCSFKCLPILDKDVSGNRVYVWVECSHAAAHKHFQPHVVSDSDRGLDADGLTEVKYVRASFIKPVICTRSTQLGINKNTNTHHEKWIKHTCHKSQVKLQGFHCSLGGHEGDPGGRDWRTGQTVLPEKQETSTLQRGTAQWALEMCFKKADRPFIMTLNWNYSLIHSNQPVWRGHRRVYEEVCVDQRVFSHLWIRDMF